MRQKRFLSWLLTLCLLLGMFSFPAYAEGNTTTTTISGDGTADQTGTMNITLVIPKKTPAATDLTYTAPTNLVYDGNNKAATVAAASGVTGLGNITVKYYSDTARANEATPQNVGTYYVGATVAEGDQYFASTGVLYGDGWTFEITKSTPTAPAAPTKASATKNSITLNAVDGCEYSKDGKTYQDSTEFTGLMPGTEYTFYQRVKATANTNVSAARSASFSTEADTYAMTITLVIKPAQTITASDVTATYGDTDKSVTASVTTPATGGGAISYAVKEGSGDYISVASDGKLTINKVPPTDGKAYVIVTAAATDDYAETTKEVTVTISKADPAAPTGLTATYGQTLANVTLPTGWTWADSTQSVGSVVSPAATFKANFAGNDNYNAASNVEVTVTVGKADPTAPTGLTATYGQTLANVTLPTGWTWADSTQSVGSVVSPAATFKANFAGNDNYNAASNVEVTVTVGKADPTAPTGLTATYGQTLANVTLPTGWTWADSTQSVGSVVSPAATFKANFAGNDNYNAASNVEVTVTVGKADPTAPTGLTATYGQTLANVTLPDGWTWADSTQSVGNVVDPAATFKANFTGNDNYNAASNVEVTVTVGKADPTAPTGLTATYGQTLANVTLPTGWTWADSTQSVGSVVSPAATFKANFAGNDNYNAASNVEVTVTVGKADPTAPTGLTATYGQTLANVTLPDGWAWADSTQSVGNVVDPAATFKANFTGNDNYNAASNVEVTVTVGKADPTAPTGLTATYGQTLANVTLPDGWTWADSTQSVGNVVDPAATFKANFAGDDNHNAASNVEVTVTVGKANAVAATVTANSRTYDGTEKPLVTVTGEATGGEMQYAIGKDAKTAPTSGYSATIPSETEAET